MNWEYIVNKLEDHWAVQKYLNDMGIKGWEVVNVWSSATMANEYWYVVLKRQV